MKAQEIADRNIFKGEVAKGEESYKGILIHDDQHSREAAEGTFWNLARKLADGRRIRFEEWNWDRFGSPGFRSEVEAGMNDCRLVVLAPGGIHRITTEVKLMLEAWLMHKAPLTEAILCLVYRNHDSEEDWKLFSDYLEDLCVHRGVFFCRHSLHEC